MLNIKEFSNKKVIFVDENRNEYTLKCDKENQEFDVDIIEDILDYVNRTEKKGGSK